MFGGKEKSRTFASAIEKQTSKLRNAQMAESVDALVSNTSGFTSIPVRPRVWVQKGESFKLSPFLLWYIQFVLRFSGS